MLNYGKIIWSIIFQKAQSHISVVYGLFLLSDLAKQTLSGKAMADFFFPRLTEDTRLCPARSLGLYLQATLN